MKKLNLVSRDIIRDSQDGIIGFAIGDAFGVPFEFKSREYAYNNISQKMIGYGTYNLPKGTWSDDTSMTLATIDSIIQKGRIDTNDMADKFLEWFRSAKYTATEETFDIGRTTLQSLAKYELRLDDAHLCGGKEEMDNGNGSLMRMLPIAYYIYFKNITSQREIYEIVKKVSSITHAHEISILGCYIYVNFAIEVLKGITCVEAYKNIKQLDYSMFNEKTVNKYTHILNGRIEELNINEIKSTGYIVDTLEAVFWLFLNSNNYNQTILRATALGGDTDTIAACTGGLLGIYYGCDSIDDSWKKDLRKKGYITQLCNKFDTTLK